MTRLKQLLVRSIGNFMTSFSVVFLTYDFTGGIPPAKIIIGALLSGLVIVCVSTGYQLQKWKERDDRTKRQR